MAKIISTNLYKENKVNKWKLKYKRRSQSCSPDSKVIAYRRTFPSGEWALACGVPCYSKLHAALSHASTNAPNPSPSHLRLPGVTFVYNRRQATGDYTMKLHVVCACEEQCDSHWLVGYTTKSLARKNSQIKYNLNEFNSKKQHSSYQKWALKTFG